METASWRGIEECQEATLAAQGILVEILRSSLTRLYFQILKAVDKFHVRHWRFSRSIV
jgi:hypothetical protein